MADFKGRKMVHVLKRNKDDLTMGRKRSLEANPYRDFLPNYDLLYKFEDKK